MKLNSWRMKRTVPLQLQQFIKHFPSAIHFHSNVQVVARFQVIFHLEIMMVRACLLCESADLTAQHAYLSGIGNH